MKTTQPFVKRFRPNSRLIVACLIAILAFGTTHLLYADAGCCQASAAATGIKVKTPVLSKTIGSSKIGCKGGNKSSTFNTIDIPGVLAAIAVQTSATGTTTQTGSQARVDNINLIAGANIIRATQLSSNAQSSCSGNSTGTSIIQNLTINGQPVNITGEPNQKINIIGGTITINAQKKSGSGCEKNITVTALKVSILNVINTSFSTSHAGVACVVFTCN